MNEKYEKIINLPRHVSSKRAQMPREDRAAQFAPYSALSGYEDAVEETARLTDQKIELDEYEKEKINDRLLFLLSSPIPKKVRITFFRPDKQKTGGAYVTLIDEIAKIDEITRKVFLVSGKTVHVDDLIKIEQIEDLQNF